MELQDFRANVADTLTLLRALHKAIPKRVDPELLDYLERLQDDPVGLELLRNTIAPQGGK